MKYEVAILNKKKGDRWIKRGKERKEEGKWRWGRIGSNEKTIRRKEEGMKGQQREKVRKK